uniref:Uncharacterized protein n=1 Tax=Lotus japonicus TaxID=34305 RepID=I3SXR3_LOTJA|nr:unknown [Lotus japonicus]
MQSNGVKECKSPGILVTKEKTPTAERNSVPESQFLVSLIPLLFLRMLQKDLYHPHISSCI